MNRSTTNPVVGIAVTPSDRLRPFVVLLNVGSDAAREISDGRKNAPREQVALDLRRPESTWFNHDE
jgi:hypothetical protein